MNICIYGAANETIDESYKQGVEALGRELALRGHTLVFGGGMYGLMGAAVRGVSQENGKSIGVSPKFFRPDGVLFEGCTEFYYTDDMRSRKALMEEKSDAFLVVPGGVGTYEEFFEMYTLLRLKQTDKPIAVYNLNGYYDPLMYMLTQTAEKGFMDKQSIELFLCSEDINEIFDYLEKKGTVKT